MQGAEEIETRQKADNSGGGDYSRAPVHHRLPQPSGTLRPVGYFRTDEPEADKHDKSSPDHTAHDMQRAGDQNDRGAGHCSTPSAAMIRRRLPSSRRLINSRMRTAAPTISAGALLAVSPSTTTP